MMKKIPRYRTFGGKRFQRVGSSPTSKKMATSWANFNRRVNGIKVRVVKTGAKYLPYVHR